MNEPFRLRIRAETSDAAEVEARAWADAEPCWSLVRVLSPEPHPEHWQVWYVTVECAPVAMTLGLA